MIFINQDELKLINNYTRSPFGEDDVYVFSVVLCDNEIDRDFERFSDDTLDAFEKMFVGVTGITDHNPKSDNQSARIFSCRTEYPEHQKCSDGKPYKRLCARAYMPKSAKNSDLILSLESGIKKEVSIGCAVGKRICSICGDDISVCSHIKGKSYGNQLCFAELRDPADVYEWSFVAVPAQRKAGVIKSYQSMKTEESMNIEKKLRSQTEQHFTADEMKLLADKIAVLEEKAAQGEFYCKKLKEDIMALSASALPELSEHILQYVIDKMNITQLD